MSEQSNDHILCVFSQDCLLELEMILGTTPNLFYYLLALLIYGVLHAL